MRSLKLKGDSSSEGFQMPSASPPGRQTELGLVAANAQPNSAHCALRRVTQGHPTSSSFKGSDNSPVPLIPNPFILAKGWAIEAQGK